MQRLKGIVQLLIAAAIVGLIVWANVIPDEGRRIEDAVYLEDAQVLPENEGKRVVVAGAVVVQEGAADPQLGISFASPLARRSVERLHYRDGWEWVEVSDGSADYDLTDASFAGQAHIGQFELDPALLRALPAHERDWEEDDLDAQTRTLLERDWYLTYGGGQLYAAQVSTLDIDGDWGLYQELEGSLRVRYRVWNTPDVEATVVGIQRGNTLCYDEDLNAAPAYEGVLDKDELIKTSNVGALIGELVCGGIPALILLVLGIRNVREL